MAQATATKPKRPTTTEPTQVLEPPHWRAARVRGQRSGGELALELERLDVAGLPTDRLQRELARELAEELRAADEDLPARLQAEEIRQELASLSLEISTTSDAAQMARYRRDKFDAAASTDPGTDLARLDAEVRGQEAKLEGLQARRKQLLLDLERAIARIDAERGDVLLTAARRFSADAEKRRDAALRELLARGQDLLDVIASADATARALDEDDLRRDALRLAAKRG